MIVSKEIQEIYKKAGVNDWTERQSGAETTNHERFQAIVAHEGQPVKEEINSVYRIRAGEDETEYIFYHATLRSKTRYGVKIECSTSSVGIELVPQLITVPKRKNEDPMQDYMATEIEETIERYSIPYTKANIDKIKKNLTKKANFYIKDGSKTYPITRQEFESAKFDDLLNMHIAAETKAREIAGRAKDILPPA